jgi:hypothetical protein
VNVMHVACTFGRLRQAEIHHRRITSLDAGNVADVAIRLSSWRNHSPQCSPRSTLSPTFASHPHMAAVCSSDNNNNLVPYLTSHRTCQDSARSLATSTHQAIHHSDANGTQIRCNRPSPEQVIGHFPATDLPLSGLFECLYLRTA